VYILLHMFAHVIYKMIQILNILLILKEDVASLLFVKHEINIDNY